MPGLWGGEAPLKLREKVYRGRFGYNARLRIEAACRCRGLRPVFVG